MGLVPLCMFHSNCLETHGEAHGYAIDGFCGFLGRCFVPIACYRGVQLPHTGYGAALRASLLSVLSLIAIKFIMCTGILVVGKGNSAR